jgi:DNA-binding NarL/FixJ family response regulator
MKVVICDDQAIVRDGLEMMLKLEPDVEIVGMADEGAAAVELVARKAPDLVLMDLKMPVMNGVEATRQIRAKYSGVKVLVLTTYDDDEWVFDAIQAGASGYLLKDTPRDEVIKAIPGHGCRQDLRRPGRRREGIAPGIQPPDSADHAHHQPAD